MSDEEIWSKEKFILDACCGGRMMWVNKKHPNVMFIDNREEEKGCISYRQNFEIKPDMVMDFRKMDFPDKSFKLVVFDPPHLLSLGKTSYYRKKYGGLCPETWQNDLKKGFSECWRVLMDYGVLIFKWSDSEIPYQKVLKVIEQCPLFQSTLGKKTGYTYWACFMKLPEEKLKSGSEKEGEK